MSFFAVVLIIAAVACFGLCTYGITIGIRRARERRHHMPAR